MLTPTTVEIRAGTTVAFTASGSWDVGLGAVGPGGREDWCECVVAKSVGSGYRGPLGALIGRVGPHGAPFMIGTGTTTTSSETGTLFLGANDNMGPCDKTSRGSCYSDNAGHVNVRIVIK